MRKKWAFLVGISDYDHREFNRLSFANTHVSDFEEILKKSGDFEEGNIITLKSDDLPEKRPNRTHIINEFDKLLQKIEYKNTLFIYFVCHGGFFGSKNYIFPLNANKDDNDILKDTSLSIDYFTRRIRRYKSNSWKVYFFIDACREQLEQSSFGKKLKIGVLDDKKNITTFKNLDRDHLPLGINFFFACCEGEKSWHFNRDNRTHSIFSYALIKGLKEKINPPIYLDDLITYVKEEVGIIVKDGGFPEQRPHDPIPDDERDQIILGESYKDELMSRLFEPEFQKKLHSILNEYDNSIENLIAIYVLDRNGKVLSSRTRISEEPEEIKIGKIINSIVKPTLRKSKKIISNSLPETILREAYRIICRVAEPELILLTVLDASAKIDPILQNTDIAVKFITQAFNGLSIAPEFPKIAPAESNIQIVEKIVYKKKRKKKIDKYLTLFDDAINIEHVLILYKGTGTCTYFKSFGSEEIDPELISGFISAVSSFGKDLLSSQPLSEIAYGDKVLLLSDGDYIRVALVLGKNASTTVRNNLSKFILAFEQEYQHELPTWRGQLNIFKDAGIIIDEIFNTSIILPHEVTFKFSNVKSLEKSISKKVLKVTQDYLEDINRNFVFIASVLKEAAIKTGKGTVEIMKGIFELRDKRILMPIFIEDLLPNDEEVIELQDPTEEVIESPYIIPKEKEKTINTKKEIENLKKSAKSLKKKKEFKQAISFCQMALEIALNMNLSEEVRKIESLSRNIEIADLNDEMEAFKKQAIVEIKKNKNYYEAAKMYKNASLIASKIFKLGVVEMEKEVKRFNKQAIECERRVER